jgi:Peptidase C39 family
MAPWAESFGVLLLGGVGVAVGAWFSRRPGRWWLVGYFVPFTMAVLYAVGIRYSTVGFTPPISWMLAGRTRFAIMGFIATMVLTTPLSRLPRKRDRVFVAHLMAVVVCLVSVWPFLAPAFNHRRLARLATRIDADGVCLQNTDYTCGPAAAVTALRRLGFKAEEGELAILAHTTSATGTPPDILAATLMQRYGHEGLICDYRVFGDVSELKSCGPTLAVVKFNLILDHYVTVLAIRGDKVVVADPLHGMAEMSFRDFGEIWRYCGITLSRN